MAALTRQQRVFNAIFPPSESPFLAGHVVRVVGPLHPTQQRGWDVVTRTIYPRLSQLLDDRIDVAEGEEPLQSHGAWADCASLAE